MKIYQQKQTFVEFFYSLEATVFRDSTKDEPKTEIDPNTYGQ